MSAYNFQFNIVDNVSSIINGVGMQFARTQQRAQEYGRTLERIQKQGKQMQGFSGIGAGLVKLNAGVQLLQSGAAMLSEPIAVFNEFTKTAVVLEAQLGQQGAGKAMQDLAKFANEMGQPILQVQDSFTSLVNRGIVPTMDNLERLTNFALLSKKPINQYVEAILDMQSGEAERMKEFGVSVQKQGANVVFTYNNIATKVKGSQAEIMDYLLKLGDTPAAKGLSKKMAGTLEGSMTIMKNNFQLFEYYAVSAFAPLMNDVLPPITNFLADMGKWLRDNKETLGGWVENIKGMGQYIVGLFVPMYEQFKPTLIGIWNLFKYVFDSMGAYYVKNEANSKKMSSAVGWIANVVGVVLLPVLKATFDLLIWVGQLLVNLIVDIIDKFTSVGNAIAGTFNWIGEKVSWLTDMFVSIYDKIFPGFKNAFQATKDWLWNTFIQPIVGWFADLFHFDTMLSNVPAGVMTTAVTQDAAKKLANGGTTSGGKGAVQGGLDTISGDKGKMTNVYINIQKLSEGGINVMTTNIHESEGQIKQFFERLLMDAVNQVNYGY
jgi:hypothetical protein